MLDQELSRLLLSLALLLLFALVVGHAFDILRLPRVVGEICAGILLGPSFLGYFAPELQAWIFSGFAEQSKLLSFFYWLGLILLMFTAGFRIPTDISRGDRLLLLMLIVGGIGLPFLFGFVISPLVPNGASPNPLAFSLVIAIASAVTSIPVLARIFLDLNMLSSRFAQTVLMAAAIQDLILWIGLSVALSIQQGQDDIFGGIGGSVSVLFGTFLFAVFSMLIVPALLRFSGRVVVSRTPDSLIGYTLLVCLVLVSLASVLKINIVFGALFAGLVIGRLSVSRLEQVKRNITSVATWFFVPIYFALVGLQMNLPEKFDFTLIFGFLILSSLIKMMSIAICVKFLSSSWPRAFDYGMTMNARGGPGIVLASVAFSAKIVDEVLFVALILTSILTSLIAGVWLRWRRSEIVD